MLAGMLRFSRREKPLPSIKGDLSSWIFQLHHLTRQDAPEPNGEISEAQLKASLANWLEQIAGLELNLRKAETAVTKARHTRNGINTEEMKSLYQKDRREFDSQFNQKAREVLNAFAVPPNLPATSEILSWEGALKMLRATRAVVICLAVHGTHPFLLIRRAVRGDRQSTLDLVKVDKLFLHDNCTEKVIKDAELMNDHSFLQQLARAQNYQPKIQVRDVQHLYFYLLFLLEKLGSTHLPTGFELWRILDPHAREYDSQDAFERDFQRRRKNFEQMINDIVAEGKKPKG